MDQKAESCEYWINLPQVDFFPSIQLSLGLWQDVTNAKELHARLLKGQLPSPKGHSTLVLLNADTILDVLQIQCAVTKALMHHSTECPQLVPVTTGGIGTELIYCLSGGRSTRQAFTTFGLSENTKSILAVLVYIPDADGDQSTSAAVLANWQAQVAGQLIVGRRIPAGQLTGELAQNVEHVKEIYDITKLETKHLIDNESDRQAALTKSILTRMNVKDLLRA